MQPSKGSQNLSSPHSPFVATTITNSGDILFSSASNHQSNSFLSSPTHLLHHREHPNSSFFSLVDPNIELPTISANEVEQVLSQIQPSSSPQSILPTSRKTGSYWFSKDDSFTPPPVKRSFGGCVTPVTAHSNNQTLQNSDALQTHSSPLIAALQLPPFGVGPTIFSSSTSPPLQVNLRKQLLTPTNFVGSVNVVKQRQENLTVRLANRAKLTTAARIPVIANPSSVDSECTAPTRSVVPHSASPATPHDLPISQDPDERFRFVCPHPRCGRRYQARIGLTRHLVKYHGENVETEEMASLKPKVDLQTTTGTGVVSNEEASLSRSPFSGTLNTTTFASAVPSCSSSSSTHRFCFSVKSVRVDQRSSQSLDRSKVQRRCPSPLALPSSSSSTLACPLHLSNAGPRVSLCSQASPSLLPNHRQTSSTTAMTGGTTKVAIVSMQPSPPSTSVDPLLGQQPRPSPQPPLPSQSQLQPPFHMSIYSTDVPEHLNSSGGALTEPRCCNSSDKTVPLVGAPHCSSCCWPDDYEEFEREEEEIDFLEEDCSSDLGFESCYYPSRPTDSLPCLLHPSYRQHFHSPPPSFHRLPRGSAVDLSTTGMVEECSSCCWTADSDFSSSLGGGRGERHSSEDGRIPGACGFPSSPYPPRIYPIKQRKQRLSSTSSAKLSSRQRFSTIGEKRMRWKQSDRHGRRRTVSSSGGSSIGILGPSATTIIDSVNSARSASVICEVDGGDNSSSVLTKASEELVACPVHDCGLVCSGCENLCEHLKECHLPDSQNKPFRLIFACPVKTCRTFCANEAAFEAHFDAHLESRISGKIGDLFRRTSTDFCESRHQQLHDDHHSQKRHVKSASSLMDPDRDVFDGLCLPPISPGDNPVSPSSADYSANFDSHSTPEAFLDENWSLLQALDLLPDDVLQELLQEKTIGNGTSGTTIGIPHLSGNTPTLSNGFSGSVGRDERGVSNRLQLQTPMVVSSDGEGSTSASVHSERRYRGSVVKRQRNSLACLDLPREFEQTVSALSRAQSTQLRFKRSTPPPNTLPSASQLLFQSKSITSRAVSTEDLFHLPMTSKHISTKADSTYPDWFEGKGVVDYGDCTPCAFTAPNDTLSVCHLSDTDMIPLSSRLLSTVTTSSATSTCPYSRRYANRVKRRRRAFGDRFYTLDSRFLSSQPNVPSSPFENLKNN